MTNGTAAAAIVSDAFLGRSNPWARLFIHTAWTLFPSAKKVVAENWFGDRLRYPQAKQPSKLAPGEAGVERRELRTLAGYRDLDGDLHVVSAVCTHLGCTVAWNQAELSWDCPSLPRFPVRCRR